MYLSYPVYYRTPVFRVAPVVPVAVHTPVHVPVAVPTPVVQPVAVPVVVPVAVPQPVVKVQTSRLVLKEVPVKKVVKELHWKIEKDEEITVPYC